MKHVAAQCGERPDDKIFLSSYVKELYSCLVVFDQKYFVPLKAHPVSCSFQFLLKFRSIYTLISF